MGKPYVCDACRDEPERCEACKERRIERARDAAALPRTCNRCPEVCAKGSIFCDAHRAEYAALCDRAMRGEITHEQAIAFTARTHWPA